MIILSDDIIFRKAVIHLLNVELGKFAPAQDLFMMQPDVIELFFIHVLDRTLAYKVDQISVVKPEDTEKLQIIDGKDYVTLVTCTPYGVNDHRLLVRGARTKYEKTQESSIRLRNKDSQWMGTYKRAIAIGLAIVMALVLSGKVYQKLRIRRKKTEEIRQKKGETK